MFTPPEKSGDKRTEMLIAQL